jgi:UDP-N-acetylglucosamine 2-epimerase
VQKYHNKKVTVDGITFDSKKEARRYNELRLLQRAGEISNLQRQVKFLLIPTQVEQFERYSEKTGKKLKDGQRVIEKECAYYADFVYTDKSGKTVVEDTKGIETEAYRIKRKLMLFLNQIQIKQI